MFDYDMLYHIYVCTSGHNETMAWCQAGWWQSVILIFTENEHFFDLNDMIWYDMIRLTQVLLTSFGNGVYNRRIYKWYWPIGTGMKITMSDTPVSAMQTRVWCKLRYDGWMNEFSMTEWTQTIVHTNRQLRIIFRCGNGYFINKICT